MTSKGLRLPPRVAAPLLRVSRRVQFRGKGRILRALGFSLDNQALVPPGIDRVRCADGITIATHDVTDVMFRELWLHGHYQDDVLVALEHLLSPGQVFWDIGANYGFMSLWVDRTFRGRVRTVAFEPAPVVARTLRENLALNRANSVVVEELCLSDREGPVTFYTASDHTWNATLIASFARRYGENDAIEVMATTMDGYARAKGRPDVIKVDVEGAEHLVIAGGETLLRDHPVSIVAEFNELALRDVGLSPERYLAIFADLGYRAFRMRPPLVGWHRWGTLHEVRDLRSLPPLCNLVFRK